METCGNPNSGSDMFFGKKMFSSILLKLLLSTGSWHCKKKKTKNGEAAIFWNKKLASVKCIPYLNEFKKTIVIKNWNVCYASVFKVYGEAMPMILCTILYIPEHYYIYRY